MRKFIYSGPPSGVTFRKHGEVLLFPGRQVELPEDHPYVRTLIAKKQLTIVSEEPSPEKPAEPATDTNSKSTRPARKRKGEDEPKDEPKIEEAQ